MTAEGHRLRRRHNREGHMEYWLAAQSATEAAGPLPSQCTFLRLACHCRMLHNGSIEFPWCAVIRGFRSCIWLPLASPWETE